MGSAKRSSPSSRSDRPNKRAKTGSAHSLAISAYHTGEKEIASLKGNPVALFKLKKQQADLESYQDASQQGAASGGETSKWLIKELRTMRSGAKGVDSGRLRLLDVGALSGTAYAGCDFIEATYIDLNPRSDSVVQADFFSYPVPPEEEEYDIVSLSLVLNFVGDLQKRGEMLKITLDHLTANGMLYIVLPLACLTNSRFVDHTRFRGILAAAGFEVLRQHDSARLTYWLCRRSETPSQVKHWAKKPLENRQSGDRNNFAIVLSKQ